MNFLAVLLALLIEQVRPLPHNAWSADLLRGWARWTSTNFDAGRRRHAWVVLGVTLLAPSLLVYGVYQSVQAVSPVLALLFNVAVLYVTLGFRHFSHYFTDIRKALERGDDIEARRQLGEWLRMDAADLPRSELLRHVLEHSLLAAHRHVFGVFFWFIVCAVLGLGPAGAVFYRMAEYVERLWRVSDMTRDDAVSEGLSASAQRVFFLLDYLPARLTAFGFAVVGDFESAIDCWRRAAALWHRRNDGVILASAAGAVGVRLGASGNAHSQAATPDLFQAVDTEAAALDLHAHASEGHTAGVAPELAHLSSVVGLVWRSVLLWMFLLILVTMANLLG